MGTADTAVCRATTEGVSSLELLSTTMISHGRLVDIPDNDRRVASSQPERLYVQITTDATGLDDCMPALPLAIAMHGRAGHRNCSRPTELGVFRVLSTSAISGASSIWPARDPRQE